MIDKFHFEITERQLPSGTTEKVPVYLGDYGEELPETEALSGVVDIIGVTLGQEGYLTLGQLVTEVEQILDPSDQKNGLIIEDEERASTVRITASETVLSLNNKGERVLSSELVLSALRNWNESKAARSHS
jgi:hypothetical protein